MCWKAGEWKTLSNRTLRSLSTEGYTGKLISQTGYELADLAHKVVGKAEAVFSDLTYALSCVVFNRCDEVWKDTASVYKRIAAELRAPSKVRQPETIRFKKLLASVPEWEILYSLHRTETLMKHLSRNRISDAAEKARTIRYKKTRMSEKERKQAEKKDELQYAREKAAELERQLEYWRIQTKRLEEETAVRYTRTRNSLIDRIRGRSDEHDELMGLGESSEKHGGQEKVSETRGAATGVTRRHQRP